MLKALSFGKEQLPVAMSGNAKDEQSLLLASSNEF